MYKNFHLPGCNCTSLSFFPRDVEGEDFNHCLNFSKLSSRWVIFVPSAFKGGGNDASISSAVTGPTPCTPTV